jgi:hypothetical protein
MADTVYKGILNRLKANAFDLTSLQRTVQECE